MLSGTAALLAAGVVLARRLTPGASSPQSFQAIVANWFTYNAHGTEAPGVFQSPAGSWRARTARTMLGLSLLVFAVAPMNFYFPVGVLISGPGPWQTALERIDSWFDFAQGKKEAPRAPVITADRMLTLLTPTQRAYHDRLGSTSAREAYLQEQADAFRRRALGEGDRLEPYILSRLSNSPEAWFAAALVGSTRGESLYIWSLVVSLLLSMAIPPVLLWFLLYALAGPPIAAVQTVVDADIARAPRITEWERMVRRLHRVSRQQPADDPCSLRNHLWLGTSALNDYPVFLNRSILHDHAHILGDTGSGKTSLGLSPLVAQLIRLTASRDGQPGDRHSIVIIDLKGEPAFFHGVRAEARAAGIPFKWFTNESKRSSYVFNPFMQRCVRDLTPNQQTEILLQSLGLEHGEGYGASYFSRVNRDVLSRVLKDYHAAKDPIRSFRALREVFENKTYFKVRDKTRDAASELLSVVENLADFDALNVISQDEAHGLVSSRAVADAIDMSDVIERPQVVYFYLPAALETASVREIGKLALFSLLSSAVLHEARTGRPGRVYLVIDEFQQLVSKSVDLLLRQARSKGIAMILANQSLSDLRTRDSDLIPVVLNNTRFRQYFSSGDQQQQDILIKASGEAAYDTNLIFEEDDPLLDDTADWRTDAWGYMEAPEQLNIGPRFNRNDIIEMSDNDERCIIHVRRGTGLTQFGGYPLLMQGMHHVTRKRNDRRAQRPWPRGNDSTVTAPVYPADMPPVIKDKVVIRDPADDDDETVPDADIVNPYLDEVSRQPPRHNVLPDDDG